MKGTNDFLIFQIYKYITNYCYLAEARESNTYVLSATIREPISVHPPLLKIIIGFYVRYKKIILDSRERYSEFLQIKLVEKCSNFLSFVKKFVYCLNLQFYEIFLCDFILVLFF